MKESIDIFVEKISSYNIFNNLLPGTIFCCFIESITRFSFSTEVFLVDLFVFYFVGMILSRIGSILVEPVLESIKVKNKKTKESEKYIKKAPYGDYIEASKKDSFILVLNETNNTYRTMIAMSLAVACVKIYDWLLYDLILCLDELGRKLSLIIACVFLAILFIKSYRKQTNYITKRIEKAVATKEEL